MGGGMTIFIVEDDPMYGEMLEYRLKMNPDYTVFRFTKGKECLANLYRRPAVVTLDYSLPDMNGGEVLRRIKQQQPGIERVGARGPGGRHGLQQVGDAVRGNHRRQEPPPCANHPRSLDPEGSQRPIPQPNYFSACT